MTIVPFEHCTPELASRVGGKAVGLGGLLRAGLPVPPGFVVTTDVYRRCLSALAPQFASILHDSDTPDAIQTASKKIQALINATTIASEICTEIDRAYLALGGQADMPVAVRSSASAEDTAGASFAGQQDTFLWIRGVDQVRRHIVRCWASLYTARAIDYRSRMDFPSGDLAMGVIVQQMVPAQAAGVMMTLDPVSGDRSQIVIESAFGLGEIVVRGEVEPDRFRIDKQTLSLQFEDIANKRHAYRFVEAAGEVQRIEVPTAEQGVRSLGSDVVIELARFGRRIEEAFGRPMDIEWAVSTDPSSKRPEIFMLQARPETVWSNRSLEETPEYVIGRHDEWDPLQGSSGPGEFWTTTNIGEACPGVQTPLSWTVWSPADEDAQRELGYRMGVFSALERKTPDDIHQRFNQIFYGRQSWQVRHFAMLGDRMPGRTGPEVVQSIFGHVPEGFEFHPTKRRYPLIIWRQWQIFVTFPPKLRAFAAEYATWWNTEKLRVAELDHDAALELFSQALQRFTPAVIMQSTALQAIIQPLLISLDRLAASTGIDKVRELAGVTGNAEMAIAGDLWRISRGQMSIEQFVDRHGFQGPDSGELSSRVWREDDAPLRRMAEQYASREDSQDPLSRESAHRLEREATERATLAATPWWKRGLIRLTFKLARQHLPLRGVAKCSFLQAFDVMRACARRIGEHLVAEGRISRIDDVFYLTVKELTVEFPDDPKDLIARRNARRAAYKKLTMPTDWEGMPSATPVRERRADADAIDSLKGVGVSRGVVEGRVRVVLNPDFAEVEPDEILVAPTTDPSWSSIMFISSAIVVDIGSALSHAAVVAREMNLPCVVNTRTGTTDLRTGDRVLVDGSTGVVQILERSQS